MKFQIKNLRTYMKIIKYNKIFKSLGFKQYLILLNQFDVKYNFYFRISKYNLISNLLPKIFNFFYFITYHFIIIF